jgi:TonB family protein
VKSRKINIMKTTPELTDAEIHEMMDFNQVIALAEAARVRSKRIIGRVVATVLITALVGAFFLYNRTSSSDPVGDPSAPFKDPGGTAKSVSPDSMPPAVTVPSDTARQRTSLRTEVAKSKPEKPLTEENKKPVGKVKEEATSVRSDSAKSVFLPAEPADGYQALYDYFRKQLRYPEQAIKDSIQGITTVTFIINTQGKPEHVTTDHALGQAFDDEAIRLIENMPAWKPAQLDGSPVKSKLSVPITFTIKTSRQQ